MTKRAIVGRAVVIIIMVMLIASCSKPRTAQDWFDLTWAGLAGSDTLSFKGNTVLLRANRPQPEGSLAFSGELRNHQVLTLIADSPVNQENSGLKEAASKGKSPLTTFQLNGRKWAALDQSQGDRIPHPLARVNPLAQLEEIHNTKSKSLRLESGAARGTKVLRIELAPEEAKALLRRQLGEEMELVLANWKRDSQLLQLTIPEREALNREVLKLWSQGNGQLSDKLDQAEVRAVYHLTIDTKSGLPRRLTSNNKITFPGDSNLNKPEILVTDCSFR
ncbi:hypothetical protein [Paenibacillus sp. YPG26]|uniref:hypothetical protein n=1 Tax=Paenibacillus sp. YPG26 TaxID=2878915 RepID=UPI00203E9388|nr:hypothetical protein [Paenibacillus sp. YPG26]USB34585.1 hypothetical protein LDO05_07440 [Paenibacillus sp. YPG26]